MSTLAKVVLVLVGLALLLPGICSLGCTAIWLSEGAPSITRELGITLAFWIPGLLLGALGVFLLRKVAKSGRRPSDVV